MFDDPNSWQGANPLTYDSGEMAGQTQNQIFNNQAMSPEVLSSLQQLGWTGGNPLTSYDYSNNGTDGNPANNGNQFTPEFQAWMQQNGITSQTVQAGNNQLSQVFMKGGQPVTPPNISSAFGEGNGLVTAMALGLGGVLGPALAGGYGAADGAALAGPEAAQTGYAGFTGAQAAGAGAGGTLGVEYQPYTGPGSTGYQVAGDASVAPGAAANTAATNPALIDSALQSPGYGASTAGIGGGVGDLAGIAGPTVGGGSAIGNALSGASDWMKANPGLTNVGGQLVNGLIGAYSANNALNAQKDAANKANALWAPYNQLGQLGINKLTGLVNNPGSITSDPGYAFGLGQGTQAIDRSAASKGGLYSGATLKALNRYGTDYSTTKLNDAYTRYSGLAQLGANGTSNMSSNTIGLGNAGAASSLYTGQVANNAINGALGQFNFSNGQYPNYLNGSTYKPGS